MCFKLTNSLKTTHSFIETKWESFRSIESGIYKIDNYIYVFGRHQSHLHCIQTIVFIIVITLVPSSTVWSSGRHMDVLIDIFDHCFHNRVAYMHTDWIDMWILQDPLFLVFHLCLLKKSAIASVFKTLKILWWSGFSSGFRDIYLRSSQTTKQNAIKYDRLQLLKCIYWHKLQLFYWICLYK